MKGIALILLLWGHSALAGCPDYFAGEQRELNSTQRHNLCQLTQGKVVLVVNTASYCGYTKQFKGLEALNQEYRDQGLLILGFPSNDFQQEAGEEGETAAVCQRDYGVTFPMFNRVSVRGDQAIPLFKGLTLAANESPAWNFHKYLIGRDGQLLASYGSRQRPDEDPLLAQLRKALAAIP